MSEITDELKDLYIQSIHNGDAFLEVIKTIKKLEAQVSLYEHAMEYALQQHKNGWSPSQVPWTDLMVYLMLLYSKEPDAIKDAKMAEFAKTRKDKYDEY
jgi:hypothetical protein